MIEKRRLPRHQLHVPILFGFGQGVTTDVSATGVRFESRRMLDKGTAIEFELALPDAIQRGIVVRCEGKVVRTEVRQGKTFIAATIDNLTFDAIAMAAAEAAEADNKGVSHA
jgi:hypothetical protein